MIKQPAFERVSGDTMFSGKGFSWKTDEKGMFREKV